MISWFQSLNSQSADGPTIHDDTNDGELDDDEDDEDDDDHHPDEDDDGDDEDEDEEQEEDDDQMLIYTEDDPIFDPDEEAIHDDDDSDDDSDDDGGDDDAADEPEYHQYNRIIIDPTDDDDDDGDDAVQANYHDLAHYRSSYRPRDASSLFMRIQSFQDALLGNRRNWSRNTDHASASAHHSSSRDDSWSIAPPSFGNDNAQQQV
jgi:hypothetical protein